MLTGKKTRSVVCPVWSVTWEKWKQITSKNPRVTSRGGKNHTSPPSLCDSTAPTQCCVKKWELGGNPSLSGWEWGRTTDISSGCYGFLVRWKVSSTVDLGNWRPRKPNLNTVSDAGRKCRSPLQMFLRERPGPMFLKFYREPHQFLKYVWFSC